MGRRHGLTDECGQVCSPRVDERDGFVVRGLGAEVAAHLPAVVLSLLPQGRAHHDHANFSEASGGGPKALVAALLTPATELSMGCSPPWFASTPRISTRHTCKGKMGVLIKGDVCSAKMHFHSLPGLPWTCTPGSRQ